MLWASCKDYADSTSNERDLPECTGSGMVFDLGEFNFPGNPHVLFMWVEYLMNEMSKTTNTWKKKIG